MQEIGKLVNLWNEEEKKERWHDCKEVANKCAFFIYTVTNWLPQYSLSNQLLS